MLVLRRTAGQSITIGGGIEVMVLGATGQVALEIKAPKGVDICRTELLADELAAGTPLNEIEDKLDRHENNGGRL